MIDELARNRDVFKALLMNKSKDEYLYKPSPEKWCLLEVVCHLYDEEKEDFRARTKQVLTHPDLPLPPINPVGWVSERDYLKRDYTEMLQKFLYEREESVEWLQSLSEPKWSNTVIHPKLGVLSAWLFLTNWLAHDYLHIRQVIQLKFDYLKQQSGEDLLYAGNW